jgi:hypothetical protein
MLQGLVVGTELPGHAQARVLQQRAQVGLHLQDLLQLEHLFVGRDTEKDKHKGKR